MKITVSTTIMPDLPDHREVEAETTLDAVRAVLGTDEAKARWLRCRAKGGGSIVISAFEKRVKEQPGSQSPATTNQGGLELR